MSGVPNKYRDDPTRRLTDRLTPNGDCLEWAGSRNEHGYGSMRVDGKHVKAHRFAWEIENGPIPPGMSVCHKCDNPPCCNVDHLFIGTQGDNGQDMARKGRHGSVNHRDKWMRGESHSQAVLTISQVRSIRNDLEAPGINVSKLARDYGVARSTIRAIRDGKTWKDQK